MLTNKSSRYWSKQVCSCSACCNLSLLCSDFSSSVVQESRVSSCFTSMWSLASGNKPASRPASSTTASTCNIGRLLSDDFLNQSLQCLMLIIMTRMCVLHILVIIISSQHLTQWQAPGMFALGLLERVYPIQYYTLWDLPGPIHCSFSSVANFCMVDSGPIVTNVLPILHLSLHAFV